MATSSRLRLRILDPRVRVNAHTQLRAQWLDDCAIRLLCLLALDRFGDWVAGDKVTAPVRETSAQALAVLLRPMQPPAVARVVRALLTMLERHAAPAEAGGGQSGRTAAHASSHGGWEVRHGAMLALKYALAVRADLLPTLLPLSAPTLERALVEPSDEVKVIRGGGRGLGRG